MAATPRTNTQIRRQLRKRQQRRELPAAVKVTVKEDSPYWIDGFKFDHELRDPHMKRHLEARAPFCNANDPLGVVIQSNVTGLFTMLVSYLPFSDAVDFVKFAANDFGWQSENLCLNVINRYVRARVAYLNNHGHNEARHVPRRASNLAKKICELVDCWRLASPPCEAMTDNRQEQMRTLREQWQRDFRDKPHLLIDTALKQSTNNDTQRQHHPAPNTQQQAKLVFNLDHLKDLHNALRTQAMVLRLLETTRNKVASLETIQNPSPETQEEHGILKMDVSYLTGVCDTWANVVGWKLAPPSNHHQPTLGATIGHRADLLQALKARVMASWLLGSTRKMLTNQENTPNPSAKNQELCAGLKMDVRYFIAVLDVWTIIAGRIEAQGKETG